MYNYFENAFYEKGILKLLLKNSFQNIYIENKLNIIFEFIVWNYILKIHKVFWIPYFCENTKTYVQDTKVFWRYKYSDDGGFGRLSDLKY